MKSISGLFIHGVGTQKPGYSAKAQAWLSAGLPGGRLALYGQEVVWADILDDLETKMMRDVGKRGSSNHPAQRLVMETLADALCYRNRQEAIFARLDTAYARTRADEVYIFAHSLGGLLAVEWLRARPRAKVAKLVTFGCNLQLFHLGGEFESPAQIAMPDTWVNAFYDRDMLGWPLRGWLPQVSDVELAVSGWLGWTGLAHIEYFSDTRFWKKTLPKVLFGL